jgi:4-carboxymuconolactone decarboxylase
MTEPVGPGGTLQRLDAPTRALVVLAAAIAAGDAPRLDAACRDALEARIRPQWVDELLLQSVLMVGWPRTLVAAEAWRRVAGRDAEPSEDGGDYSRHAAWERRGEAICRVVYGANYECLRENVRRLHPILERWMLVDGYGRTLGRGELDLTRRELCVAAQVAVQGAERQLHSHLRGARHAGASPRAMEEALLAVEPFLGEPQRGLAVSLWAKVGG